MRAPTPIRAPIMIPTMLPVDKGVVWEVLLTAEAAGTIAEDGVECKEVGGWKTEVTVERVVNEVTTTTGADVTTAAEVDELVEGMIMVDRVTRDVVSWIGGVVGIYRGNLSHQ